VQRRGRNPRVPVDRPIGLTDSRCSSKDRVATTALTQRDGEPGERDDDERRDEAEALRQVQPPAVETLAHEEETGGRRALGPPAGAVSG
jgi:hypothetical protein